MNAPDGILAAEAATPKLRSRKDGAAIPLDDVDRRLLNLMQGSFPIAPRPYAHVAELGGITEDEAMARVQHLLDKRIVRQVTPIFDTRALGYSSMLVAAKVDPEHPHEPRRSSTRTRVSRTTICATTNSTCGSRSPPSPTRSSGWRERWRRSRVRRAPSRCASCRR